MKLSWLLVSSIWYLLYLTSTQSAQLLKLYSKASVIDINLQFQFGAYEIEKPSYCEEKAMSEDGQQIPPDHAQIDGIIISIFNRNDLQWAMMKVTTIKGYGSGFRSSLAVNDTIEVKLDFISPKSHIGISVNDSFSGNIKQGISELGEPKNPTYEINEFTKF